MDKGQLALFWGGGLFILHELLQGQNSDLVELWSIMTQGGSGNAVVGNPGLIARIAGQLILIVFLSIVADAGGDASDLVFWFLGALTLLLLITSQTVQGWLTGLGPGGAGGGTGK